MIKAERGERYNPVPGDLFRDRHGRIWYCLMDDKVTCIMNVDHTTAYEENTDLHDVAQPLEFEGRLTWQ